MILLGPLMTRPNKVCLWTVLLIFLGAGVFLTHSSVVLGLEYRSDTIQLREESLKILSALENKMGSHPLIEKTRSKLSTLSDRQTRLMSSLSELMAGDGQTAGADIAFLFIAVLIILS